MAGHCPEGCLPAPSFARPGFSHFFVGVCPFAVSRRPGPFWRAERAVLCESALAARHNADSEAWRFAGVPLPPRYPYPVPLLIFRREAPRVVVAWWKGAGERGFWGNPFARWSRHRDN